MGRKTLSILFITAIVVMVIAGIVFKHNNSMNQYINHNAKDMNNAVLTQENTDNFKNNHDYAKGIVAPRPGQPIKKFILVAESKKQEIAKGIIEEVWTFNGRVPGPEIRVKQGDFVQVVLKNYLKEPVTIHWHGYPLNSAVDGVPGWNQDAVRPGETFTYEFSADVPGTYWYHSHQESSKQVDKGLYGSLVVEPSSGEKADKDYILMIDEWMQNPVDDMDSMPGMGGGENPTQSINSQNISEEEMMGNLYNIYTVNGKSGNLIEPIEVKLGDTVRLRFINAGYRSHGIHIPDQDLKVVSTDGQDIKGAGIIKNEIINIAPGERYDIEFIVSARKNFIIDFHDNNKYNSQIKIPVEIVNGDGSTANESNINLKEFDLVSYGISGTEKSTINQTYDVNYDVRLGTRMDGSAQKYTINGQIFEELPSLKVKTGNLVKVTYYNDTEVDHPMHLHGHFFEILAKNGIPVKGAAIMKDTLLIRPKESYTIAFKADNPGRWVQHCHELHHAAAGMMQKIEYTDYIPNYNADPNNKYNKPE